MEAISKLEPFPVCEQCWLQDHVKFEPDSVDQEGTVALSISGVELPPTFSTGSIETCCLCGMLTIAGIYDLLSKDEVYFTGDVNIAYRFDLIQNHEEPDEL